MKIHIICEPIKKEIHGTLRVQEEILKRMSSCQLVRTDLNSGILNTIIFFPAKAIMNSFGCDINHFWNQNFAYVLCLFPFKRPFVTCYDLIYLKDKNLPLIQRIFNKMCMRGMRKAEKIITISEFSKKEIVENLKVDPSKVVVAYPAYDKSIYKIRNTPIPSRYAIPSGKKFILYVGSEQKRKNVDKIILALAQIKKKMPDLLFVKIGKPQAPDGRDKLLKLIKKLKLEKNVLFLDYVPEKDLPAFYNNASLFIFPSSYEGFGLPVLEAMACGCPVITTNYSSLPEVGGKFICYIEPKNTGAIARNIEKILKNPSEFQESLKKRVIQSNKFSWNKSAKVINEAYITKKK
jgi:glycosyltransferase involved in cell wall biosynthesis